MSSFLAPHDGKGRQNRLLIRYTTHFCSVVVHKTVLTVRIPARVLGKSYQTVKETGSCRATEV